MLPRLDRLIAGTAFDPATEHTTFRIAATDNATSIIAPVLCRTVLPVAQQVRFSFIAWRDDVFDDLAHGRLDLALMATETPVPSPLQCEEIYREEFVCVVSSDTPYTRQLTLKQYLAAEHVSVGVIEGSQNIPEKRLAAHGYRRKAVFYVPYFGAAIQCVIGTKLMATVPRRFAATESGNPTIKVLKAPAELTGFGYLMIWHPRVNTDAAHAWLREAISKAGKNVAS
jgi:DNA-binding transcriptional LysR family regulator